MRKIRLGSVSDRMLQYLSFTVPKLSSQPGFHPPCSYFPCFFIIVKHNASQDSQLTAMIVLYICFFLLKSCLITRVSVSSCTCGIAILASILQTLGVCCSERILWHIGKSNYPFCLWFPTFSNLLIPAFVKLAAFFIFF